MNHVDKRALCTTGFALVQKIDKLKYHLKINRKWGCTRGGSRVHLVRRMMKSNFLKKIDTFYEL